MKFSSRLKKTFVLSTLFSALLFSACAHKTPEDRVDQFADKVASKLEFNDQQKAMLADIVKDVKEDMTAARARRAKIKGEVESMILSPELNQTRLKEILKNHESIAEQNMNKYLPKIAALHKTLNDKQKNKIVEKLESLSQHLD